MFADVCSFSHMISFLLHFIYQSNFILLLYFIEEPLIYAISYLSIFNKNIVFRHYFYLEHLCMFSHSVMPDSGLQPIRLLCPSNFPGKNTGAGYHSLFQGIFLIQGANSCLPMADRFFTTEPPGEWVAISFFRGSSQSTDRTLLPCIADGFLTTESPGKP